MEEWKQVPFAPKYEASTHGNVRNKNTGRVLSTHTNEGGYLRIKLQHGNESKSTTVHRVIAKTFIPNPEDKYSVNHKNHKRDDNRLENLEWFTAKEQTDHQKKSNGSGSRPIWKCTTAGEKIEMYESIADAARSVTTSINAKGPISISARKNEKSGNINRTSYGFVWKYHYVEIPGEEWKPLDPSIVKGAEGYQISSEGRLRNRKGRECFPHGDKGGYMFHSVNPNTFSAHRLVALTFLDQIPGKHIVNHIDGNKSNCRLSNLEWVTPSENVKHAFDTGLNEGMKSVKQYDLNGIFIAEFPSVTDARRVVGGKFISPHDKVSQGFQWRTRDDHREVTDVSQDVSTGKNYPVKQYDMSGNFIREFESVKKASFSVDGYVKINSQSSHGFQWRRSQFDGRPVLDLSHKTKRQRIS